MNRFAWMHVPEGYGSDEPDEQATADADDAARILAEEDEDPEPTADEDPTAGFLVESYWDRIVPEQEVRRSYGL